MKEIDASVRHIWNVTRELKKKMRTRFPSKSIDRKSGLITTFGRFFFKQCFLVTAEIQVSWFGATSKLSRKRRAFWGK